MIQELLFAWELYVSKNKKLHFKISIQIFHCDGLFFKSVRLITSWLDNIWSQFLVCQSFCTLISLACMLTTLCDPMDFSPPVFSVHEIFQERRLEWVAISYSRGSSWPRDQACLSCVTYIGKWILTCSQFKLVFSFFSEYSYIGIGVWNYKLMIILCAHFLDSCLW